ncbi:MAG TPA: hypothetical protein VK590_11425 [Saprospiraceae bacterium]|nr:hypothetical protein [Saprospiraceae bacterium]
MKYSHLLFLLGFTALGFFSSCKQESDPETVVRMWQKHLDENEFKLAKEISTDRGKQWLDIVTKMIESNNESPDTFKTVFKQIKCTVVKDSAICRYSIIDQGEELLDSMYLKKINGKWLVDVQLDEMPDENDVQDFYDDIYEEAPDSSVHDN